DYIYDRKGEAKNSESNFIVSMPNAALAFRAVFWFAAQSLRSRMGHSRVFQKSEYERLYINERVDDDEYVNDISIKLLVSTIIIDKIRTLIQKNSSEFQSKLPIFKKSTYYFAGFFYAMYKSQIDQ